MAVWITGSISVSTPPVSTPTSLPIEILSSCACTPKTEGVTVAVTVVAAVVVVAARAGAVVVVAVHHCQHSSNNSIVVDHGRQNPAARTPFIYAIASRSVMFSKISIASSNRLWRTYTLIAAVIGKGEGREGNGFVRVG